MATNVVWEAQPGPQTDLLTCPCFEVFFGGARGGGKTDGMLGEWISHADKYGENAIGLMVRRSRTELAETIERSRILFLPLGAKFNETDKMWRFPNGARLRFAYLERDSDADVYQGHSYTRLYVEEAGTFPSLDPILKLMATLRSGAGVPVGIRLTGNPGGPGQQWIRARYIDPNPGGYEIFTRSFKDPFANREISTDWVFIPSRIADNQILMAQDPGYIARLSQSGGPKLVKAWLEGDFTAVEGAFFDNWDSGRHVVAPFDIPENCVRFRSMDWGSASPASIGWWAVIRDELCVDGGLLASDRRIKLPRGCLVRYREWYVASGPGKGLKLTNKELANGIVRREKDDPRLSYGVLDPSAFAEDGGPSIAEEYNKILQAANMPGFRKADNKRVARGGKNSGSGPLGGWAQMRTRLTGDEDGNPMVVCFSTCTNSIRTIPALQHDRDKPEDLDTEAEDHCADDWRYACMSRPYARTKPEQAEKPKFKDYVQPNSSGVKPGDWMIY